MVTEAIILAGGLGTRLRSVLSDTPKPMAPVAGQPFLAYLLQYLEASGIRRVVLAVGYRSEAIYTFFGRRYGALELIYSVEEEPLGTGGALLQSFSHVHGQFAFVVNGDTYLRLKYEAMAAAIEREQDARLVVALRRVPDTGRYGAAVVSGGRLQGFQARGAAAPGTVNAGCYLMSRDIFQGYPLPPRFSWEDFLQEHIRELRPIAFECEVSFIDIGVPAALEDAQTLIPAWVNEASRT